MRTLCFVSRINYQQPLLTNNNLLLGLNNKSLRSLHDGLLNELEKFSKMPRIMTSTVTWLTENDSINKLTLPGYHLLESKPRTSCQERGVVAFFVQESVTYKPLLFETKRECLTKKVDLGNNQILYFCVVYRPQRHKLEDICAAV